MLQDISDLLFWSKYLSFSYCERCFQLHFQPLKSNFGSSLAPRVKCERSKNKYVVPRFDMFPRQLMTLSESDIKILRPFIVHIAPYSRAQDGYRYKNGIFFLTCKPDSVLYTIQNLQDNKQKQKLLVAYNFLMNDNDSSYKYFNDLREHMVLNERTFLISDAFNKEGIECALWPNLYPKTEW